MAEASLFDMHLHGDWFADPWACSRAFAGAGGGALGCTVEPAGYEALAAVLSGDRQAMAEEGPGLVPALGLHPWYLGEGEVAEERVARFCELAPGTRLIGEVGLDRGKAHRSTFVDQRRAFEQACGAIAPGSVLSVHSVNATGEVLDALAATGRLDDCACVFHWFSGTSDELARARGAGCYFSVGPFMLRTRKGREYARQIPVDRLLLETDLPERPGTPWDPAAEFGALRQTLGAVAASRGVEAAVLGRAVARTSAALLAR